MAIIGVVGSGTMGREIAKYFAQFNHTVVLIDTSKKKLEDSLYYIEKSICFSRLCGADIIMEAPEKICSRIKISTDLGDLRETEYIIENITERIDDKKKLYEQIDKICSKQCIFMVNTSCISITQIAQFTGRQDRVIGTHFMNPVDKIHTVETIRGFHTSEDTLDKVTQLLENVGKKIILVQDSVGFVSNRISHLMMNEAAFIVQEEIACAKDIDEIFKSCYGHRMGPLETADLIGLDTVVNSLQVLYDSYQDSKFRCCLLLRNMVNAGLLGRKTGEGFYKY